ncbi:unnamed protein product [Rotaria sp. Silwood1]|nr:unnamed protein product [Rotaria sp. Silwood1]CAF3611802.1 unnamed protein product [Rotaria sp. Silwood1]CAF3647260.1 unnamed protein product [Rotaria sp. Silwood1]CAF4547399.1 unnamed protein product [Rotaria sp. Silwood1]CAF4743889.1 unnamed protein product [Rotaria sp. Silwood1]
MNDARYQHTAFVLTNEKILVSDGFADKDLNNSELYAPSAGIWTMAGNMNIARKYTKTQIYSFDNHTATLLVRTNSIGALAVRLV